MGTDISEGLVHSVTVVPRTLDTTPTQATGATWVERRTPQTHDGLGEDSTLALSLAAGLWLVDLSMWMDHTQQVLVLWSVGERVTQVRRRCLTSGALTLGLLPDQPFDTPMGYDGAALGSGEIEIVEHLLVRVSPPPLPAALRARRLTGPAGVAVWWGPSGETATVSAGFLRAVPA